MSTFEMNSAAVQFRRTSRTSVLFMTRRKATARQAKYKTLDETQKIGHVPQDRVGLKFVNGGVLGVLFRVVSQC